MGLEGFFFYIGQGCVRLKIHYWPVLSDFPRLGNYDDERPLLTGFNALKF